LRDLAARLAESEGNPTNARTIFTMLDRINRGVDDGSLPTLLRLYRFLSPFLSSPSRPFLLDDILTVHRWRIVMSIAEKQLGAARLIVVALRRRLANSAAPGSPTSERCSASYW